MPDAGYTDQLLRVIDEINNTVIPDPDAPFVGTAFELS
jgi:hypothetical protein